MVSTHPMERGHETLIDRDPQNEIVANIEQPVFEAIAQTAHDSDVQEVKRPADKKPPTNRSTRYRTTKSETPLMPAEYKTLTLKLPAEAQRQTGRLVSALSRQGSAATGLCTRDARTNRPFLSRPLPESVSQERIARDLGPSEFARTSGPRGGQNLRGHRV
jgi:hypothetical protein